ncbi:MAG: beta-lactamase family protein [Opitutus sp.]|nr:beta-lactamase family protein [Opitutus sp.]MCS6248176.1 beta-lactamase family protein [Opitutus sp.]MCS6273446.1 beta-lactamase family protein [Opitutus sp.]MCS6276964.1 beta-lactamase family protein [Opitutus sp.]MCS6299988.1 beta-lactamase family protein [Opitutus sp.]
MNALRIDRPPSVVLFAGFVSLLARLKARYLRILSPARLPALPAVPAKRRLAALVGALLLSAWPAFAQLDPGTLQTVLDASRAKTSATGASAAIVRNGEVLWQGQSGVIAPGSAVPVTADTLFVYASASKMVTAAMTSRLAEQGKLGLDDKIGLYLPADVPGASSVTVRQLLQQTSSYPDIYRSNNAAAAIARLQQVNNPVTRADLINFIEAPTGTPGVQHAYSNTNYILLGEVIERASGKTFTQVYQDEIATPLGLTRAFVTPQPRGDFAQSVDSQFDASAPINYFNNTEGLPTTLYGPAFGDGPVAGTAVEGALFLDALARGKLLGPEALAQTFNFDPVSGYGFGIYGTQVDGKLVLDHTGEWAGYTSTLYYDENRDLTIMTLANSNQGFPAGVIFQDLNGAVSVIPEPSTYTALAAAAALGVAVGRRRRNGGQRSGLSA